MRYAVLSDIHGNLEALTAVLAACRAERIDRYLCLGDSIGYGADPSACLACLQEQRAVTVAGNHEAGCSGKLELGWFHRAARAALEWTRDQLSFTELDLLRRLPLIEIVEPFTLVHASLRQPQRFEYLVDLASMIETLQACETLFCLAGHTHLPGVVEYDRAQRRVLRVLTSPTDLAAEIAYLDEAKDRRYLVNPGSIGQPRDADCRASFAMIDTAERRLSFHRVSYDIAAAQRKIRQANLPGFLADRLAIGR